MKSLKKETPDNIEKIGKMFSEIGLDEYNRQAITEKIRFDFDFSKDKDKPVTEITTTTNTKND